MSTLSNENNSDLEIPTHETPILDVEISNIQESVTASFASKKTTSKYYKYFTLKTDNRWHCNHCRYGFAILLFKNNVIK